MKNCTPLWREAHFEVKRYKTPGSRTTFGSCDVEKAHAVVARSTFRSQNVKNTRGSDHFWRFRCRFASLHYTTLHYTTLHYITLHYTTLHNTTTTTTLHYTPLHSTTLHYTPLHSTTLNYTTLHFTTLHYTTLHYTTLHYLPLHFTTLHYTPLHYNYNYTTTLHYTRVVPVRFWRFRFDFLCKELISRELVFDSIHRDSDTDSIRNVSSPTGSKFVSKGFLINFNSIACDSIFDLDSFLNFDSIACGSSCVPIR